MVSLENTILKSIEYQVKWHVLCLLAGSALYIKPKHTQSKLHLTNGFAQSALVFMVKMDQ